MKNIEDLINITLSFLKKDRDNLIYYGFLDTPSFFYYDLKGDTKKADPYGTRAEDNKYNPFYVTGELTSVPISFVIISSYFLSALAKPIMEYNKKLRERNAFYIPPKEILKT